MTKTILITGATDGIGLLTAKMLADAGHLLLLHGRSPDKLSSAVADIGGHLETFVADLSSLNATKLLSDSIRSKHDRVDIVINNAGVFKTPHPRLADGRDVRFVVNTLVPYTLTRGLLPVIPTNGRILNLSSAAQAPVNVEALTGGVTLDDMSAYAQSKLALTIWSAELARELPHGPVVLAVNPGSLLASKMVKEGFGVAGNDLEIGASILCRLALDPEFAAHSGKYWDNDAGRFAAPNAAASDPAHVQSVMQAINSVV
ncbi:MAG: SDR family NAD(P)-dependent oxidoreductase [Pseudomonadota bacterium]